MENTVIERIRGLILEKGLSPRAFAQVVGFNYSTLNNYLTGRRSSIDNDLIIKIISTFNDVSSDWLLTGQGPMLKTTTYSSSQHIQNSDGNIVAGGSMIVPSHYAQQKIAEKKEGKLLEVKAELFGLKQEAERLKTENGLLRDENETLKKENSELHKQLLEEKERLISVLMERK